MILLSKIVAHHARGEKQPVCHKVAGLGGKWRGPCSSCKLAGAEALCSGEGGWAGVRHRRGRGRMMCGRAGNPLSLGRRWRVPKARAESWQALSALFGRTHRRAPGRMMCGRTRRKTAGLPRGGGAWRVVARPGPELQAGRRRGDLFGRRRLGGRQAQARAWTHDVRAHGGKQPVCRGVAGLGRRWRGPGPRWPKARAASWQAPRCFVRASRRDADEDGRARGGKQPVYHKMAGLGGR